MILKKKSCEKTKLRDYQQKTVDILNQMDKKGNFSTIVNLPTGAGKTKTVEAFLFDKIKRGDKVLWLCDRINILEQSAESFENDNCYNDINMQLVCASKTELYASCDISEIEADTQLLFASVRTLVRIAGMDGIELTKGEEYEAFRKWIKTNEKVYVVYDEAHHIGSTSAVNLFRCMLTDDNNNDYKIENFGLIGLTATVYRGDRYLDVFNHWFKDGYINNEIVHSQSSYGEDFLLAEDGKIVNTIKAVDIVDLIPEYLIEPTISSKSDAIINKDSEDDVVIDYLTDNISKEYTNWGKTAVFVKNITIARKVSQNLKDKGISCSEYTSDWWNNTGNVLSDFKKGNIQLLLVVDKINEGVDIPDLETIYLFAPMKSHIVLRQRVGRVLRKTESGVKKGQIIYQEYDGYLKAEDYLKPLPKDSVSRTNYSSRYEYLELLNYFSAEEILQSDSVGWFVINDNNNIYYTDTEYEGYKQFYQMIVDDCRYPVFYQKINLTSLSDYAKLLGISEEELKLNIKRICFSIDAKVIGKAIASGKRIKNSKIRVNDEELEAFFRYVIDNGFNCPEEHTIESSSDSYDEQGSGNGGGIRNEALLEFLLNEAKGVNKKSNTIEASRWVYKTLKSKNIGRDIKDKKYSTDLVVKDGDNEFYDSQVKSVRRLMRSGAYKGERIKGELSGLTGELSFIGLDDKFEPIFIEHKPSLSMNKIADDSLKVVTNALITRVNHIRIDDEDIDEYTNMLRCVISKYDWNCDVKTLALEFLMALGYFVGNNELLRMQIHLFKESNGSIPKVLKYLIYEQGYSLLFPSVEYDTCGNCTVIKKLNDLYNSLLDSYKVSPNEMSGFSPVDDVICDFRPYILIIPYYQGVKPEFLCRLTNEIVQTNNNCSCFINAFGGSAANNYNFFLKSQNTVKQIYNDYGVLNYKFAQVVKDLNKMKKMKGDIAKLIKAVFKDDSSVEKELIQYKNFYQSLSVEGKYQSEYIKKCAISEIDELYHERINRDKNNTEDKLQELNGETVKRLNVILDSNVQIDVDRAYEICRRLHALRLVFGELYKVINDENIDNPDDIKYAIIFFVVNTFSDRQYYDYCDFYQLYKFINVYKERIDTASELLKNIDVRKGDALELMKSKDFDADASWYLDIPYSETDVSSYSGVINDESLIDSINNLKGNYNVSSRFNICVKNALKDEDGDSKNVKEYFELILENKEIQKKSKAMYLFYTMFLDSTTCCEKRKYYCSSDETYCATVDKKAKYVLIPFTKSSGNKQNIVSTHKVIDRDSIRRMLMGTCFTNIPIEVMITDADIDFANIPVRDVSDGVWVLPTFKMRNSYGTEPEVIIMKYETYISSLEYLFFNEKYNNKLNEKNTMDAVNIFSKMFDV